MKRRFCFVIDGKFLMDTTSPKDAVTIYRQLEHMGKAHVVTNLYDDRTVYRFSETGKSTPATTLGEVNPA